MPWKLSQSSTLDERKRNQIKIQCIYCLPGLHKPIIIQHTHSIFERWHDFHLFSGNPKLVGVNVVGGATRLFLSICLHRCTAILPVQRHTDHSGKISLENAQHHQNLYLSTSALIYRLVLQYTPWGNPHQHIQLSLNTTPCQRQVPQLHLFLKKPIRNRWGYTKEHNTTWF